MPDWIFLCKEAPPIEGFITSTERFWLLDAPWYHTGLISDYKVFEVPLIMLVVLTHLVAIVRCRQCGQN